MRLQSKKFEEFMGAYFELQIFSGLRQLDCDVEVHPTFSGTCGKVDFGVTHSEDRFYVEATVCGIGKGILRSNANEEDAVRKIREEIRCPHSHVWIVAEGELRKTLGKNRLARPVQELLDYCSPDAVFGFEKVHPWRRPRASIQEGNWKLDIFLRPIPLTSDGKGQVMGPVRVGPGDAVSSISKSLGKKAEDWTGKKRDDDTFVIAMNVGHSDYSEGDELRAIYGKPDPIVGQDSFSPFLSRVAAVIMVVKATLGSERSALVRLHENPDREAPECLQSLRWQTGFGEFIGLP